MKSSVFFSSAVGIRLAIDNHPLRSLAAKPEILSSHTEKRAKKAKLLCISTKPTEGRMWLVRRHMKRCLSCRLSCAPVSRPRRMPDDDAWFPAMQCHWDFGKSRTLFTCPRAVILQAAARRHCRVLRPRISRLLSGKPGWMTEQGREVGNEAN